MIRTVQTVRRLNLFQLEHCCTSIECNNRAQIHDKQSKKQSFKSTGISSSVWTSFLIFSCNATPHHLNNHFGCEFVHEFEWKRNKFDQHSNTVVNGVFVFSRFLFSLLFLFNFLSICFDYGFSFGRMLLACAFTSFFFLLLLLVFKASATVFVAPFFYVYATTWWIALISAASLQVKVMTANFISVWYLTTVTCKLDAFMWLADKDIVFSEANKR